jgi:hypothetical protein
VFWKSKWGPYRAGTLGLDLIGANLASGVQIRAAVSAAARIVKPSVKPRYTAGFNGLGVKCDSLSTVSGSSIAAATVDGERQEAGGQATFCSGTAG